MIKLTLVYKDNSTWFAGAFETLVEAEAWLAAEQTRSYWDPETTYIIES